MKVLFIHPVPASGVIVKSHHHCSETTPPKSIAPFHCFPCSRSMSHMLTRGSKYRCLIADWGDSVCRRTWSHSKDWRYYGSCWSWRPMGFCKSRSYGDYQPRRCVDLLLKECIERLAL
ncbi:hypothetical protein LIA77_06358 [Sarocladium implicatum]|nr:hypothetical protein LIA77_06358 [Sarocladium implicatum]